MKHRISQMVILSVLVVFCGTAFAQKARINKYHRSLQKKMEAMVSDGQTCKVNMNDSEDGKGMDAEIRLTMGIREVRVLRAGGGARGRGASPQVPGSEHLLATRRNGPRRADQFPRPPNHSRRSTRRARERKRPQRWRIPSLALDRLETDYTRSCGRAETPSLGLARLRRSLRCCRPLVFATGGSCHHLARVPFLGHASPSPPLSASPFLPSSSSTVTGGMTNDVSVARLRRDCRHQHLSRPDDRSRRSRPPQNIETRRRVAERVLSRREKPGPSRPAPHPLRDPIQWQHRRRLSGRGVAAGLRLDHERELHDGDHRRLFALCSATPASR